MSTPHVPTPKHRQANNGRSISDVAQHDCFTVRLLTTESPMSAIVRSILGAAVTSGLIAGTLRMWPSTRVGVRDFLPSVLYLTPSGVAENSIAMRSVPTLTFEQHMGHSKPGSTAKHVGLTAGCSRVIAVTMANEACGSLKFLKFPLTSRPVEIVALFLIRIRQAVGWIEAYSGRLTTAA